MTLKQLEYFTTIVECGTITAASKKLNISQPPLSLQIKNLEDELGVVLFKREGKSLKITDAGLAFRDKALQILNLAQASVKEIKDLNQGVATTLRMGVISSVCTKVLPQKIPLLNQRFPGIDYQIYEDTTSRIMELIRNGVIELGFIRDPYSVSFYSGIRIYNEDLGHEQDDYFVALGTPDLFGANADASEISLQDLESKPLIMLHRFDDLVQRTFKENKLTPRILCHNTDIITSITWAESGLGIALMPYTSALLANKFNVLSKKVVDPVISSKTYLIWDKKRKLSPAAKYLISLFS